MSRIRFIAPVLHVTGRRHHHRIIKAHARHWMILKCSESDAYGVDAVAVTTLAIAAAHAVIVLAVGRLWIRLQLGGALRDRR